MSYHTRWATRQDLKVLTIMTGMTEDEYIAWVRQRQNIAMVSEKNDEVVALLMYQVYDRGFRILRAGGDPGGLLALIRKLISKLCDLSDFKKCRISISFPVKDRRQLIQGLFDSCGFVKHFTDESETVFHYFRPRPTG